MSSFLFASLTQPFGLGHPACATAAEPPQIDVDVKAEEVVIGESFEYQVILRNMKAPQRPDMSAFEKDFSVAAAGDQSMDQVQISIVNGVTSQFSQYGHVFAFQLTPKHAGNLTIPAPFLVVDGQKIAGPTAVVRVIAPEKQDLVQMEVLASRNRVYAAQPFDINLRVLVKPIPGREQDPLSFLNNPPALQIGWLQPPAGLDASTNLTDWLRKFLTNTGKGFTLNDLKLNNGFSLFPQMAVLSLYTGREVRNGSDGKPIHYFVYELKRTFTPQKTGTYNFSPALLKGRFIDSVTGRNATARSVVVTATPCVVEVREVPSPRPATFCGGIGAYKARASASVSTLRVGDPLTLTLEFERQEGSGSLDLISAPDLAANPQMAADFNIIDKAPTGQTKENVKRFAYDLRPKRAGAAIPALTVTFFNPDTEKFVDVQTEPVPLKVTESTQLRAAEVVAATPETPQGGIRSAAQGVFQNVTDLAELRNQSVNPAGYAAAAAGAWAAYAGMSFLVLRRRRRAGDQSWQRRQRARRESHARMAEARAALAQGNAGEAVKNIQQAMTLLIGNMLNLPAAGMTSADAAQTLSAAGVSDALRAETVELLNAIEAAEYGSAAGAQPEALLKSADALLRRLHHELESKRT